MFDRFFKKFSHDLGIDLGTANTLVHVQGKGIAIREPSIVARHAKTKQIIAIGTEAKKMLGKTPASIEAIKPLEHGVISDFDGYFAIPCKVGDVLKFEYIGLPAKTMVVADRH